MRAFLTTLVLTLVLAVAGAAGTASPPSAASGSTAAASPTGALAVCTPAWGSPVIPTICV